MELRHIHGQLKLQPDCMEALLRGARINRKLKRYDRALKFYEGAVLIQPDNKLIAWERKEVQRLLAADLIPLVENSGSGQLWHDLAELTEDREGIYQSLAELLRQKNRRDDLADVLLILYRQQPDNEAIQAELGLLLIEQDREQELRELEKLN
jgi:tetratricopeptide (TPR) repeat protein